MATSFLSSEEYDERAHQLYEVGDYDAALDTLNEGLRLYPHSVELHVGLGYTRLAREEFAWARLAFDKALVLDPDDADALVGLGETVLRFGRRESALHLFARVRESEAGDDAELLLTMGRALYRERLFEEAQTIFIDAARLHASNPEAAAALGYTHHRLGDNAAARAELQRALDLDPAFHEAAIFLGHLMYENGEIAESLRRLETVPLTEHWDPLALRRLLEMRRTFGGGSPSIGALRARLREIESEPDPIDQLLAEVESEQEIPAVLPRKLAGTDAGLRAHRVRTVDGRVYAGSWFDIVRQLRDALGLPGETVAEFMRRRAEEVRARTGFGIPTHDPESFLRGSAHAGLLRIDA